MWLFSAFGCQFDIVMFPRGIVLTVFHLDVSDQFSLTVGFQVSMCLHLETMRNGEPDLLSN